MTGRGPKSLRTEQSLRALADEGLTRSEAARHLGVSRRTVDLYASRFSLPFKKGKQGPKAEKGKAWIERIRECAERGLTRSQTAEEIGLSYQMVVRYALAASIEFPHEAAQSADLDRAEAMASMYRAGRTLKEIGEVYGITRERVRQIIGKHHGLNGKDGGEKVRARRRKLERKRKQEEKCLRLHGCSLRQYRKLKALGRKLKAEGYSNPLYAFRQQRSNASLRGIEWNILLWDWWQVWEQSGKWKERGRGRGYMMCRVSDQGAYEVGNVYIATGVHNGSVQPNNPYRLGHPDHHKVVAQLRLRREVSLERAGEAA